MAGSAVEEEAAVAGSAVEAAASEAAASEAAREAGSANDRCVAPIAPLAASVASVSSVASLFDRGVMIGVPLALFVPLGVPNALLSSL